MKSPVILSALLFSLVCIPMLMHAQEVEEKQIRLTEASLTQIVKKIVDAKNLSMQKDFSRKAEDHLNSDAASIKSNSDLELQMYLQQIEALENALARKPTTGGTTNDAYRLNEREDNAELNNLKTEIDYLKDLIRQKSTNQVQPIIINPSSASGSGANDSKVVANNEAEAIKNQLDSLLKLSEFNDRSLIENNPTEKDYTNDLDDLKSRINNLKTSLENKKTENSTSSDYQRLNATIGNVQKNIFFANNSINIDKDYFKDIDALVTIIKNNKNVDVLINGFASKKGNPVYNQNLSMQRTEAVKQILIQKGIHPIRILTSYHGIDYNKALETEARRVEITFIIRKQ